MTLLNVNCRGCLASYSRTCKHSIAFLFWICRRTTELSPTEVACYWNKPSLAAVSNRYKFSRIIRLKRLQYRRNVILYLKKIDKASNFFFDFLAHKGTTRKRARIVRKMVSAETIKEDEDIFNLFMGLCKRQKKQNLLTLSNGYPDANEALSIHRIACNFRVANDDITFDVFMHFLKNETSSRRITQVINATKGQSNNPLWKIMRYGRITASIVHEACRCNTDGGSTVEIIMGSTRPFQTKATVRGLKIEGDVLKVVEKVLNKKIRSSGVHILLDTPIFAASPDSVGEDFVVEIKSPALKRTREAIFSTTVLTRNILTKFSSRCLF